MAKVTEYSRITKLKDNDILLVDGPDGTRTILQRDAAKHMAGEVVDVTKVGGKDKVELNFTDNPIGLATSEDLNEVENALLSIETASGDVVVIHDTKVNVPLKEVKVVFEPVQEGSGDASPSNVRPITGWTGAKVMRRGKNLLKPFSVNFSSKGSYRIQEGVVPKGQAAIMSFRDKDTSVNVSDINIGFVSDDYTTGTVTTYHWAIEGGVVASDTSNSSSSGDIGRLLTDVLVYPNTDDAVNRLFTRYDIQVELGIESTPYEPCIEDVFDVTFPSEAGVVYSGTADLTAGTLTVDRAYMDVTQFSGLVDVRPAGTLLRLPNLTIRGVNSTTGFPVLSNRFTDKNGTIHEWGCYIVNNGNTMIFIVSDPEITTLEQANAWLADNPTQVLYQMANPIVYDLTPQQIKALKGSNIIATDAGTLDIAYVQDVRVQNIIAEESDSTATRAFTAGEYVIILGKFYKVMADVSAGDAFVPGTNVEETTVGEELNKNVEVEKINDILEIENNIVYPALESTGTYNAYILNSDNTVRATTTKASHVAKYPVTAGTHYKLTGTNVKLNYDVYALVAFSATEFTGESPATVNIIEKGGTTLTDYDIDYTPADDGFLYVAQWDPYRTLSVYVSERDSQKILRLTNTKKETIKIQAFGDSITDDSWRSDNTTWLTLLPEYLTQRTLSIKNDAVGGSHIGHGKVNSDTGKYHELEYNYVYDLMTNPDIFDPDSDIIVMFVGTNDFNSSPLGEWGDTTADTFYGAARMVCEYISHNTAALFLVVTPIARPDDNDTSKGQNENGERINTYGATLRDYAEALIKTCDFYQFPVIDLFHNIGWTPFNVRPYMDAVGIHPSVKGSNTICAYISSEIKKHLGI